MAATHGRQEAAFATLNRELERSARETWDNGRQGATRAILATHEYLTEMGVRPDFLAPLFMVALHLHDVEANLAKPAIFQPAPRMNCTYTPDAVKVFRAKIAAAVTILMERGHQQEIAVKTIKGMLNWHGISVSFKQIKSWRDELLKVAKSPHSSDHYGVHLYNELIADVNVRSGEAIELARGVINTALVWGRPVIPAERRYTPRGSGQKQNRKKP